MAGPESALAVLEAQVEDLQALLAVYSDLCSLTAAEADTLRHAAAVVEAQADAACAADVPALSGTLRLPGVALAGQPVALKFVLPRLGGGEAGLQVLCNAPRQHADALQALASATASQCALDCVPCLLLAADQLTEAAGRLAEGEAQARQQHGGQQPPAAAAAAGRRAQQEARRLVLSRRCLWFHHIKNLGKRKQVVAWGAELGLGGLSKPGFPGIVLVEGAGCDVDEYVARLRRLRWQAMAELEAARRLPRGIQELGEDGMGRLAAAARQAGLEPLFLTALKLGGGGGG